MKNGELQGVVSGDWFASDFSVEWFTIERLLFLRRSGFFLGRAVFIENLKRADFSLANVQDEPRP